MTNFKPVLPKSETEIPQVPNDIRLRCNAGYCTVPHEAPLQVELTLQVCLPPATFVEEVILQAVFSVLNLAASCVRKVEQSR